MRKWFAFTMVICLLIAMTACTAKDKTTPTTGSATDSTTASTESPQPDTPNTDPVRYLIQENAENVISFPIPHRNAMPAEELTLIQNSVQNKLLAMTGEKIDLTLSSENVKNKDQAYTQYSILMESQITYESDTHVSIVWTGLFNAKGAAHPTHWLLALNYNPKTLQTIPFAEKYAVNNQLYTTFADLAETAIKDACGGTLPGGWGSFRDPLPAEEMFIAGMTAENEFYYYLQDDGVTISYPVAHPIGDHKEVTIPYDQLTKGDSGRK